MELVEKFKAQSLVIVGSKHDEVSKEMRRGFPSVKRFLSQKEILNVLADFKQGKRGGADPAAVASIPVSKVGYPLDTPELIRFFHAKKMEVFYWTVNEEGRMKSLVEKQADGLISDYPDRISRALGRPSGTGPAVD